jgi:Restriction endonuclease S subunits
MEYRNVELSELIEDIAAGPFGSNLKASTFTSEGFPIIDGANLKEVKLTDNITKFVTENKARSLSRSIAKRGDVVVTISGNVGQISYIPENSLYKEYLCSQRQFRVTFDELKVYVPYLVYYFHTREGRSKILSFANQTGVPALSQPLKNFKKICIKLPSLEMQRKSVKTVELLTDKIELNNQLNDYLSAICEIIVSVTNSNNTMTLADISFQVTSRVSSSEVAIERYVSTESLLPNKGGRQTASSFPGAGKVTVYQPGDTLISNIRPYFKKIWYANCEGTCSSDVIVFRANEKKLAPFLYSILRNDNFFEHVMAGAKGTKMPRGDKKQIMQYPVQSNCEERKLEFLTSLVNQIGVNTRENAKLSNLRNALLSKLITGEIDISKI